MKRLLIDTNIYSHALRGTPDVVASLRQAEEIAFCAISVGELLSGFKAGTREKENRRELDEFLDSPRVTLHSVTDETAEFYAAILSQLRAKGQPIPTNDIWIAATALLHGLPLYTKDAHFRSVPGLLLVD